VLKVINAGLGRTGTTSLQAALELLGLGPCYHMFDIINSEERLSQWESIICAREIADWRVVFDGYASAVDGPPAIYYRQIAQAFPEAKVILTVRDAERWYKSTYDTLFQFALRSRESPPPASSMPGRLYRVTSTMFWDGLFGGRFTDKDHAIEVYRRRNEEVIASIDPERLLVYEVSQGWEPLCAFLGTDVPAEDFPHANDTQSMREVIGRVASGAGPVAPELRSA
jgi:hypothetical protein